MNAKQVTPIVDIKEELDKLWDAQKESGQNRACLFNLIVFVNDSKRAVHIRDMIHPLLEKFPCRIFFIQSDDIFGHEYLNIRVSAELIGRDHMKIACEQINIETSPFQLSKIPFLILPHLVPDLPIYLLWGQDPTTEKEVLPYFETFASRLVFDSDCIHNLQQFSEAMLSQMDSLKIDIMDISWGLSGCWRDVLGQTFDSPEKIHELNLSKDIQIAYNRQANDEGVQQEMQAIYLQAWLATRLNWRFLSMQKEDHTRKIKYSNGANEILITLNSEINTQLKAGSILGIDIATIDDHFFFISRREKLSKVVVHISSLDQCELPFSISLPNMQRGSLFMKEIFYLPVSNQYQEILKLLSQVNWD
jgi:glucose-6-phosphate dehydrogenase assembly protein OpcA